MLIEKTSLTIFDLNQSRLGMGSKNPEVNAFLSKATKWQAEMNALRVIVLDCGLTEEFKWRSPCYSHKKSNLLILGGFKDYCALSFFKGSLLSDADKVLVKPGENSQSSRLIKFTSVEEIMVMKPLIKAYIHKAIEVEKLGLKVDFKESTGFALVDELQDRLAEDPALKNAFEGLTTGRQRGYNIYFSAPKKIESRKSRIEKYVPKILSGKGFHDCTCGLSKRLPTCDGSHKQLEE